MPKQRVGTRRGRVAPTFDLSPETNTNMTPTPQVDEAVHNTVMQLDPEMAMTVRRLREIRAMPEGGQKVQAYKEFWSLFDQGAYGGPWGR